MRRIILTLSDSPEQIAIRINVEGIGCYHASESYPNQTFLVEGCGPHYVKETPEEIDALIDAACAPDTKSVVHYTGSEWSSLHIHYDGEITEIPHMPTLPDLPELPSDVDTTIEPLQEGKVKKGGQNPKPTTKRPVAPKGQEGRPIPLKWDDYVEGKKGEIGDSW